MGIQIGKREGKTDELSTVEALQSVVAVLSSPKP